MPKPWPARTFLVLSFAISPILPASFGQGPVKVIRCPDRLPGVEQKLDKVPEGWQVGTQGLVPSVTSITLYDGPVIERASLVPDSSGRDGEKVNEIWEVNPRNPRDFWIECNYLGTTVTLIKNIGRGFRKCTAQYDPNLRVGGQPSFEELRCR